jgi:putative phosphoribosyl transferase
MIFRNRQQAGQQLAEELKKKNYENPLILALPRGGVPVAAEVARRLHAPLEVLLVRKLGAPFQPELALGAICEDSPPLWKDSLLYQTGLEPDDLGACLEQEKAKILKQKKLFRQGRPLQALSGRTLIVVDDGLATGATMEAAVRYLKHLAVNRLVVAVPVGAAAAIANLRGKTNEVIVLQSPVDLMSIGQWYEDFSQVSDSKVIDILKSFSSASKESAVHGDL